MKRTEQEVRAYLKNLDLSFVGLRLMKPIEDEGKGWTQEQVDKYLAAYREFVFLMWKWPKEKYLRPFKELDYVWHTHILYTQDYMQMCEWLENKLGAYYHHVPDDHVVQKTGVS